MAGHLGIAARDHAHEEGDGSLKTKVRIFASGDRLGPGEDRDHIEAGSRAPLDHPQRSLMPSEEQLAPAVEHLHLTLGEEFQSAHHPTVVDAVGVRGDGIGDERAIFGRVHRGEETERATDVIRNGHAVNVLGQADGRGRGLAGSRSLQTYWMGCCPPVTTAVAVPSDVCQQVTGDGEDFDDHVGHDVGRHGERVESAVQPAVSAAVTEYSPSKRLSTSTSSPTIPKPSPRTPRPCR